jgi:hypothetical protein
VLWPYNTGRVVDIYSNTAALKKAVVFYFLGIKKLSSSFSAGGG